MDPSHPAVRAVVAGLFGLIFGSFLTVVVSRVPERRSVVRPRSRCPQCGTQIRAMDNIPVVSYLLLRGRCRGCGLRISPVYPLIELATAGLFAGAFLAFEHLLVAAMVALLLSLLLAVALIDAVHRIVPNRLVYPALLVFAGLIVAGRLAEAGVSPVRGAIGFAAYGGGLLFLALLVPAGMGMGDVKLGAVIGLVLGSIGLSLVGVAAAGAVLLGGIGGVVALTVGGKSRKHAIPFGPYMAAGAAVAAFAGQGIAAAYLQLL